LVVDEVLAVGDAEFQKKCLGKMGDVAKEGRTVLFVSHNISNDGLEDYVKNVAHFNIVETEEAARMHTNYRKGLVVPKIQVELEKLID
jgi:ABC-type polysaccharide/polyol phosphate transport system ATPase subunit